MHAYAKPELRVVGSLRDLTMGQAVGQFTDCTLPVNTPFNQIHITFSNTQTSGNPICATN
jgi:hypothetical protein